jgi:hypothetical protein
LAHKHKFMVKAARLDLGDDCGVAAIDTDYRDAPGT